MDPAIPKLNERIDILCDTISLWLNNQEKILERSVEKTEKEGLFPRHDILYMLKQIEKTVNPKTLHNWCERVVRENRFMAGDSLPEALQYETQKEDVQKVLVLHPGNIPLVGFQDLLATLLSGSAYYGKLSKKDPWLLDGLLQLLVRMFPKNRIKWSVNLEDFYGVNAHRMLFAGSVESLKEVAEIIKKKGMLAHPDRILTRTARFSFAWLTEKDIKENNEMLYEALASAILRYEGRGCRSVALVVAPCELDVFAPHLIPAMDHFIRDNPPRSNKFRQTLYWFSYLKSTGRSAFMAGDFILTDDMTLAGKDGIICWMKGGKKEMASLSEFYGGVLQNIYVTTDPKRMEEKIRKQEKQEERNLNSLEGGKNKETKMDSSESIFRFDSLSQAQSPPVDWQPDGVDVLGWLCFP